MSVEELDVTLLAGDMRGRGVGRRRAFFFNRMMYFRFLRPRCIWLDQLVAGGRGKIVCSEIRAREGGTEVKSNRGRALRLAV